jgi:filamentous hemagglutinin family protein
MKAFKRISKRYYLKHILICALIELMLFFAPVPALFANPNPSSGTLPTGHSTPYGGVGAFNYDNTAHTLDITNVANRAVINWHKFDIGQSATVTFQQTSSSAWVLNRVSATDGMASGIKGALNANGGVIIVNPRGIVFGPSALINAGKFIASGLGISNSDFRDFAKGDTSILKFDADSLSGNVINNGTINASDAVYLVGKNVTNTGTVSCPGGMVVMAAGEKVFLNHLGSRVFVEKLDTGYSAGDHKVTAGGNIEVTGGGVLLAAGDILSQAAITNAASFVAQANQNVDVTGDIDAAGDVQLFADYDHVDGGDFHSTAPIAATGNIEVRGNDVLFDETVDAGGDLTIVGRDCHPPEWEWGNVTAMKTLTAGGNIKISDTGEQTEWVDGHWEGQTWIDGHWEWHYGHKEWVSGHWEGGWYVPGYWETTYAPGIIFLHDDVTAGGNLMLCNNTETFNDTGSGVRLQAGRNVILAEDGIAGSQQDNCTLLHGRNNLEIVALNGQVTNDSSLFANPDAEPAMPGASLTTISVEGSTLLMEQTPSFNLDNFTYANQINTDLTLVSHNGSVTAVETGTKPENAADQWHSIGATAQTDITLSGSGSIKSGDSGTAGKSLWAKTGNISVTAGHDFSADKDIDAGGNITAAAGDDIRLAGNVTAGQNITLTAVDDVDVRGNVTAGKDVDIYASDHTIYLGGDVLTDNGHIIFHNNVIANGFDGQRLDAGGYGSDLIAKGNMNKTTRGNLTLDAGRDPGAHIYAGGNVTTCNGNLTFEDDVIANGVCFNSNQTFDAGGFFSDLIAYDDISKVTFGNLTLDASNFTIYLGGDVTTENGNLNFNANVVANGFGSQRFDAGGWGSDLVAKGNINKTTCGDLTLDAGRDPGAHIYAGGNVTTFNGNLTFEDDVIANGCGNQTFNADGYSKGLYAMDTITKTTNGDLTLDGGFGLDYEIDLDGDVTVENGSLILGDIWQYDDSTIAAGKKLQASTDVTVHGNLNGESDLTVDAGRNICFGGDVSAIGNLNVSANPENTCSNVFSWGKLSSDGDMLVEAGHNIFLGGMPDSAIAWGNMALSAGEATGHENGELTVSGNLQAEGDITLSSSGDTTYLGGNVTAGHDLILNNNTKAIGFCDQTLKADNQLTAFGYVRKTTAGDMYLIGNSENGAEKSIDLRYTGEGPGTSTSYGNLWILGENDIQISDDVTTFGPSCFGIIRSEIPEQQASGGVAIISETGSIYTDDADGALNVSVTGSSDHKALDYRERGVYGFAPPINSDIIESAAIEIPETPEGVAAIAIVSAKELKIGDGARLEARGIYYDGTEVDDRGAIGFLNFDAEIPEGTSRNQGVPFDLAIYTASRDSSVTIDCPVTITSTQIEPPVHSPKILSIAPEQIVARGAMAIDALDIVTLGEDFRQSLSNGEVGNRLEVCSRITEWLDDAAGRLPFPKDLDLPDGYNYGMRGAGAENPDIGEGAPAWALEYRPRQDAAPIQQNQLKSMGCPALMNWVAKELGVEQDQIQLYVEGAMAMSGDVQPCEICAQLKNTALVLLDADGSQLKALAGVVNEFAGGAPPSEEQMAMIAAVMNNPQEGSQYALAAQWLDALTNYVNILNKDLKLPMDESLAFAQKYTSPAVNSDNAALASYVQARLMSLGG